MIIGITGCPGSGKSELTSELVRNGWALINADDIGREVVEGNPEVLGELVRAFGEGIIDSNGALLRRELGRRAFAGTDRTKLLNGIVHPPLIGLLKKRIDGMRLAGADTAVDCALIFEWEIEGIFDAVVTVAADERLRRERIMARDGRSPGDVERLFAAQLPQAEKITRADIAIMNNGPIEKLHIWGKLLAKLPGEYKRGKNGGN